MNTHKSKFAGAIDCTHCDSRSKSIFCHLRHTELEELNEMKSGMTFRKGQIIFGEGAHPLGLYCVNNGKIKLSHRGEDGKEQIVRLSKEGDVLGYRALLTNERYNATAVALDDTDICFIPRDTFFNVLKNNPDLSFEIIKMLSTELRKAEDRITDLAQKPVRERMAEGLLFLKETYGFEADGSTINIVLSREDIANLVGTATETAIRLLSEFKNDKIVEFVGKKIRILDNERLIRTAHIYD
ncbi:Crp/Fnr family transcriptional regulator [Taibaiella soli]|nr:Crp/Fnr family transcriptional regulator [Taibaiella soli]